MTRERRDGPIPGGGAYSEAVYMNDAGELAAKEEATQLIITECAADGTWLAETIGRIGAA